MKKLNSAIVVLILTVVALFLASAKESFAGQSEYYSRGGDGILRMKHSPVLGLNIPIAVWIDGQMAGAFAKGHVFERVLAPGRHTIYASRPGRQFDSWFRPVDIRPGETLSFVVNCTVGNVVLTRVGRVD